MTNSDELRLIMAENKLKAADIAECIDVSIHLVRAWLLNADAARHRPMKNRDLDYLRLKLEAKK